jgi:2-C-methyl-D-erythritol 4-phosphate cytidylyltransferase
VIAAAGSGQRLGAGGPKAFVPLAGRPMVEWSIAAFRAAPSVRSIVVACPPGHVHDLSGGDLGVVDGGATRAHSVANALEAVSTELVAIHDAARPLVTPELIEDVIVTLAADPEAAGAIAATPVTDTIKQVPSGDHPGCNALSGDSPDKTLHRNESGELPSRCNALSVHEAEKALRPIESTLDRRRLWAAQTPQVFRIDALRGALAAHSVAVAGATDEAMIVEEVGGRVLIHPAPTENLKVTTPLDLKLAELLLAERSAE